jgi:3-hydroxyisobutyrate dehydrogenase-like beta-hydroxyacid dehydrogenase
MSFQRIGILSIGEMGFHWARLLTGKNIEVLTFDKNRSQVTRRRAVNAGVTSVPSMVELASASDLIVSLVVPTAARQVATELASALSEIEKKSLYFLDANAISPMTAKMIQNSLADLPVTFIDGCIIGSAAKLSQDTILYVSGPAAAKIELLRDYGFTVKTLGPEICQASAFKIIYAGLTKGLQGLLVELLMGAKSLNLLDQLIECYDDRFPGLVKKVGRGISALPVHAGRRAQEMDELQQTLQYCGLTSEMAPAVRKVLESIAALNLAKATEDGTRKGSLQETLALLGDNGLIRK